MVHLPRSVFSFAYRRPQVLAVISSYEDGRNCIFTSAATLLTEKDIAQFRHEIDRGNWLALAVHVRRFLDKPELHLHHQLLEAYNTGLAYWESVHMEMISDSAARISIF